MTAEEIADLFVDVLSTQRGEVVVDAYYDDRVDEVELKEELLTLIQRNLARSDS